MACLLGLDIGTTNIKALIYDPEKGRVVDISSRPTPTDHPKPGWSQHDPEVLWQTIATCLREVATGRRIAGLGVSSLAEAGVPLDGKMNPLYPIIAWYDRRSEPQVTWLETQTSIDGLHAITGQRVSTSFGVTKWLWIRANVPEAATQMEKWLSVPDYILWRLTGEQATDYTIGSRTLLLDQRELNWSEEMLALADLEASNLPKVYPGGTVVGAITSGASEETGLPVGTPCVLGGHDHLCGSLAAGAYRPGAVVDSTGTAQAVLMVTPNFHTGFSLEKQVYACYAFVLPGYYVIKGGMKAAGGGIEWLVRQLAGMNGAQDILPYDELEVAAVKSMNRGIGPIWLPHLNGSGSPEGDRYSRAAMLGVTIDHDRADIFRGFLESMAFYLRHNLAIIKSISGQSVQQVFLVGGATRLELLAQLKADILNLTMTIPQIPEAAATGAALLAGLGTGCFNSPEEAVRSLNYEQRVVEPNPERVDWYDQIYERVFCGLYSMLCDLNHTIAELSSSKNIR